MTKRYNGIDDDLIPPAVAAAWLQVHTTQVRVFAKRGLLEAVYPRRECMYRVKEVLALRAQLRAKIDPTTALRRSLEALSVAHRAERKLNSVLESLHGQTSEGLSAWELYEAAHDELATLPKKKHVRPRHLMLWAKRLRTIDAPALELLMLMYDGSNPWMTFIAVANLLIEKGNPRAQDDAPAALAVSMLRIAKQHLERNAYLAARHRVGQSRAERSLPDLGSSSLHDILLDLL